MVMGSGLLKSVLAIANAPNVALCAPVHGILPVTVLPNPPIEPIASQLPGLLLDTHQGQWLVNS